jgi:DNA-directed RNA polymerase sigma subunit (sigma70/sigma32)
MRYDLEYHMNELDNSMSAQARRVEYYMFTERVDCMIAQKFGVIADTVDNIETAEELVNVYADRTLNAIDAMAIAESVEDKAIAQQEAFAAADALSNAAAKRDLEVRAFQVASQCGRLVCAKFRAELKNFEASCAM